MDSIAYRAGIIGIAAFVALASRAFCEDTPGQMDKHSEEALMKTQELL